MKKFLSILIALFMTSEAFASITVMPTRIELNANKSRTNYISTAVEVKGDKEEIMRFRAYTGYFKIDEKGELVMMDGQTAPNDLSKKIRFVPSEFNVFPRKSQKVRINIVGLNSLPDGENRTVLYIEDVNPKEMNLDTGRKGINAQLIVKTRIGVPIYLDKGKTTKKCEIGEFELVQEKGKCLVKAKLLSQGNSKIRFNSNIQIVNGKKLVKEQHGTEGVVADNSSRIISEQIDTTDIEAGEYTLRYVVTYTDENGKKQNLKEEKTINIKGEM